LFCSIHYFCSACVLVPPPTPPTNPPPTLTSSIVEPTVQTRSPTGNPRLEKFTKATLSFGTALMFARTVTVIY
jgi:hypothetical protein